MFATRSAVAVVLMAYAYSAYADALQISLPASLKTTTETVAMDGLDWNDSPFSASDFKGARVLPDMAVTFATAKTIGGGQFTLTGPAILGTLSGSCDMARPTADLQMLTFEPMPGAFRCSFEEDGKPLPGQFEMQQNRQPIGTNETRVMQRGEIDMNGTVLQVRSVHQFANSRYRAAAPLGYLFERDGTPVGAVALDKVPAVMLPVGDPDVRLAVMAGVAALSLFWVE